MRAVGRLRLSLYACAASLVVAGLAPAGTAGAVVTPTVTINAPVNGAPAVGVVNVASSATYDPTDTAPMMQLLVNGLSYGAPVPCTPSGSGLCSASLTWDSTELNGPYQLAVMFTALDPTATPITPALSPTVNVTASNPTPTVTISAPTSDQLVKGDLTVTATGVVVQGQNDQPVSLQLLVDGAKYGVPQSCTGLEGTTDGSCAKTFTESTSHWSGLHTVAVTMTTRISSAGSAVVPFVVYSATTTTLTSLPILHAGKSAVIRGSVVLTNSNLPVPAGTRVRINLSPGFGKAHSVFVTTGATGHFSTVVKVSSTTLVEAGVTATVNWAASHASGTAKVVAPVVCKAPATVVHGQFNTAVCTVADLPGTTRVSLQYQVHKKWHVLASGRAGGARIPISFTFAKAGTYPMRLVLSTNKVYVGTTGPTFTVRAT